METSSLAADIFSVRMEDNSAAEMSPFFATTGVAWKARCTTHAGRPTQRVRGSGESPEACCPPALTRDTAIRPTPRTAPTRTDSNSLLGGEVHQRPSDLPPHEGQARGRAGGERGGTFPPPPPNVGGRHSAHHLPLPPPFPLPSFPPPPCPRKDQHTWVSAEVERATPRSSCLDSIFNTTTNSSSRKGNENSALPSLPLPLSGPPGIERDRCGIPWRMTSDFSAPPGISMEVEWCYRGVGESPRARRWFGKARINSVSDLFSLRAFSHSSEGQR